MTESAGHTPKEAGAGSPWRALVSTRALLFVWLPILAITTAHYSISTHSSWVHDILRRLYYFPIIVAAFACGLRGGLTSAAVISLVYLPHAFLMSTHLDPAGPVEKSLEFVLYFIVGMVAGYLADLERKRSAQLERSLEEQKNLTKQLARAGRLSALGEVVAGIAHEVKNPLHVLRQTAEIVDPLIANDAEERRMWDIHVEEIARLGKTAERFLSFAKPPELELKTMDLRDVARRIQELVGAEARQRGVELQMELPERPVRVTGDRDQLAQVGLNIALNGLNAMGDSGGRMRISVQRASHQGKPMQVMRIENNGPPIPDAELEKIFDPFHSGREEGTGLGLAISVRIAELHRGYIEAANEGLGVAFSLYLPPA